MTKQYIATRAFKDGGTEREFEVGLMPDDVDAGQLANYQAAGLVRLANDDDAAIVATASEAAEPVADAPAAKPKRAPAKRTRTKAAAKLN